ncbi:hypothetical protein MRX96_037878 [Rhipicephalus microplus]
MWIERKRYRKLERLQKPRDEAGLSATLGPRNPRKAGAYVTHARPKKAETRFTLLRIRAVTVPAIQRLRFIFLL